MIAVQMAEPTKIGMGARTAVELDTRSAQVCSVMDQMGPLGRTNGSELRPKIGGRNRTDMTRDVIDKMVPNNKRQFAARELLPSDEE